MQQHDIFCTSITLWDWATWVKSQQTITFPDISSPHSDRWWILPDKAFIIAENRECTKIPSLFFSPPSSASLSKSRWTQLAEAGWTPHTPSEGKSVESLQDIHWQSKSISLLRGGHYGAVGRGAYQMETTVQCQLIFDPATMREAAMEMSYDGMPLKISSLLSFISEFSALRLSGPRCIESPYVAVPQPPPPEALWNNVTRKCDIQLNQWNSLNRHVKVENQLWVKSKTCAAFLFFICYVTI